MLGRYLDLGSPVADHPLNAGLVAWWLGLPHNSGSKTLFDLCNKNHGTLSNFAIPASSTSGWKAGNWHGNPYQLLNFDGTDDHIQVSNPSTTYTRVTVEALFAYDSSTQADSRLAEKGANSEWTLALRISSGATWDIAFYNRFAGTADNYAAGIPAGTLVNGRTYHVVGTIAADGYARIYLNGILKGTAASSGGVPSGARSGNLELGRYSPGGPYNGKFGLWSLRYSHTAITDDMAWLLYGQAVANYPDLLKRYSPRVSVFGGYVSGGGEISGSASVTLGALSPSATGALAITGILTKSLDGLGGTRTGTLSINGVLTKTLTGLAGTRTGTLTANGTLTKTLTDLSRTVTGVLTVNGTLTQTLSGLGGTRTGTLPIGGVLTKTLAGLAGTRTGTLAVNGTLTKTLTDLSRTVTGALTVNGILAQTLSGLGGTRTGSLSLNGALIKTLGTASVSSFGIATSGGHVIITLTDLGRAITGTIPLNGAVIGTFGNTTTNGVGTVAIQGSVIKVLAGLSKSVTGTLTVGGTLTQTFSPTALSSIAQAQIAASLAQAMAPVSRTITGLLSILGVTSRTLSSVTNTATGTLPIVGDVAELLNAASLTSTGTVPLNGAVTTLLSPLELWGVSAIPVIATLSQFTAGLDRTIYGTGLDQIGSDLVVTLAPAVLRSTYVDINAGPWQWVVRTSLGKFVAQRVTPPPYNLVADAVMGGVSLNWVLVLGYPYVKNIVVERSEDNVTFTTLETVPGAPTMYADVTTVPGSVYYYRIRALGNQLSSGLSDTVEVTA